MEKSEIERGIISVFYPVIPPGNDLSFRRREGQISSGGFPAVSLNAEYFSRSERILERGGIVFRGISSNFGFLPEGRFFFAGSHIFRMMGNFVSRRYGSQVLVQEIFYRLTRFFNRNRRRSAVQGKAKRKKSGGSSLSTKGAEMSSVTYYGSFSPAAENGTIDRCSDQAAESAEAEEVSFSGAGPSILRTDVYAAERRTAPAETVLLVSCDGSSRMAMCQFFEKEKIDVMETAGSETIQRMITPETVVLLIDSHWRTERRNGFASRCRSGTRTF